MAFEIKTIMDNKEMDRAITRMAHEIVEENKGVRNIAIIGIRTGGVPIAERLIERIAAIEGTKPSLGVLDITLYRDDWSRLSHHPIVRKTEIPFSIDDKVIVLVDDVLYTGRTVRAALDALTDIGRPKKIQLAVMVDRGRRELPIQADYTGLSVQTSADEHVNVYLNEIDGSDEVVIRKGHED
uniref:bifunctional pyr operon transcriptional regulator/uracil phosphoribosyltransferase PyrR n=2 Tax=Dissulfurimicrobium sp. TaxID=2022436 RepID=UPI004049CBB8